MHTSPLHAPCSFLPLVAEGAIWSNQRHAAFPPAFCAAARTLLLVNHRQPSLPMHLLAFILQLASEPLPARCRSCAPSCRE